MNSKQWLALKASAGSGKTFALAIRYIGLLLNGAKPSEILTLTFTKKAANEMKNRILNNLLDIKYNKKDSEKLLKELEKNYFLSIEDIQNKIDLVYEDFLRSNLKIMTIDSFLNSVLKKFCWYANVSFNYQIQLENKDKIYEGFLQELSPQDFNDLLDFCLRQNMSPKKILDLIYFLTLQYFTPDKFLKNNDSFISSEDILDFAKNIKLNIQNIPKMSDSGIKAIKTDSISNLLDNPKWLVEGQNYRYYKNKEDIDKLETKFQKLREKISLYYNQYENTMIKRLAKFVYIFKTIKMFIKGNNSLSFDDITLKTYELLHQNNIDSDFFYFRLDDKITHILIDEFQDTSTIQYKILEPIINEIRSGQGRFGERSIFFVGDDKQSIYRFRGSNSELFSFASEGMQQDHLSKNYRSARALIHYVNEIFKPLFPSYHSQDFPSEKKSDFEGYIKICEKICDEELKQKTYEELQELLDHNISPSNIALLCFQNDDILELKDYIKSKNSSLDIITETNTKLLYQKEVKIIINIINYSKTSNKFYLLSAQKLAGKKLDENLNPPLLKKNQSIQEYILEIMDFFGLYGKNAQKFLELSCEYDDLDELINKLPFLEITPIKESSNGIQMMTIHKSKGLEFNYVILVDSLKKRRSGSENGFIFEYKGIDLENIFYKQKNREFFQDSYRIIKEKEKTLEEKERINALYVAFTRSKNGLVVIPKDTNSAFEILNLESQIINSPKIDTPKQDFHSKKETTFIEQKTFGRQKDFIKEKNPQIKSTFLNIAFGIALHKGLEYGLGYKIDEEKIFFILENKFGFFLPKQTTHIINLIKELRKNTEFNAIISQALIKSEISYLEKNNIKRIDAIVLGKQDFTILDYKSGINNQEEHKKQVKEYLEFCKKTLKTDKIKAYIVYVRNKIELIEVY